jgi:hypothetical protein
VIKTTIPIEARSEQGNAFAGDVEVLLEDHGWKSVLLIPEQEDVTLYDAIIRAAIKATSSRIDVHSLVVMAVDAAGYQSVVDFDVHPTLFVANSRHTDADTAKVFARMQGARSPQITSEDLAQLGTLPPKVFEAVGKFRTAIAHARRGAADLGLPGVLSIAADDAETILTALARTMSIQTASKDSSKAVEGGRN